MAASDMSWFFANTTPAPVSNNVFTSASRGDLISLTKAIDMGDEDIAVNGWRAVHSCAAKGHLDCFKLLHQRKYNGDSVHTGILSPLTSSGENVLHLAAGKGKIHICEYILKVLQESQTIKESISIRNAEDYTAIHLAAHNGYELVVELLVQYGEDAGVATDEGVTPLLLACSSGQGTTFNYLSSLENGKYLNVVSKTGLTPLHKASSVGHDSIVRKCIEFISGDKAMIDAESESGGTSLHIASQNGHLETVKLLIQAGADVSKQNNTGQTALHKAAFEGHYNIINLLLEHKANVNVLDNEGHTILMCAASGGRNKIIDRLCRDMTLKVDLQAIIQSSGENASILAANNGFHEVASKLTKLMYIQVRKNNLLSNVSREDLELVQTSEVSEE